MTKVQTADASTGAITPEALDPALDQDQDGLVDIDPAKAQATMVDLVTLDHELRDHGLSLGLLLRSYARSSAGVRL